MKNTGITLIALVVTIIVLLILAGITLNLINSGDGIIIQARWSEFVAEYTKLDEQKELYVAGKQMDKLSEEFSKVNWRSLFTNISYAVEVPETMYPVDLNQPFSIWDTADTLKATICYVEKLDDYSQLHDPAKVSLYRVDMSLLPNVEVRREYVINIASGMLYYIDGEEYKGKIYHTLKYGVSKDNPEFPIPPPSEDDLTIHYLSGFDDQEETQTVPFSQSNSATLNQNDFVRADYNFQYWKEIQLDASGNPQMGAYTGTIYGDGQTGICMNGQDMWLEADWTSDPMNEITLDANGGIFDEDDVKDKLLSYQMPDAEHVKFNQKENDTFDSELLITPIYNASDGAKYQFDGWFTEKSGGTIKVVGDIYHQSDLSNGTLYAHWKKISSTPSDKDLTIHYLSGGAEFDYFEPSYTQLVPAAQTASATLDACRFTGPGNAFTFLGWGKVFQEDASAPYQHGDYYDVVNLLIRIFDEDWETDILDIIESYEDWESDAGGEDDGEDVTDDEPEPTMEEERRAEILDYFSGEETAIQNLFTNSTMSLNGLADWFVANQSYLTKLQAYEETLDEDDDEENLEVDYYDQQSGINMNGQDLWLEAVWTNEYVIILDANGGTIDGQRKISVIIKVDDDYDTVIFDPEALEGFTFKGWYTVPDGGTPFDTTTKFDPASSPRTLYAQWEKNDDPDKIVEIIFDGNGGTMMDDDGNSVAVITQNRVVGSLFQTMPTPDRLGYIFDGWFTTPTGGTEIKSNDTVTGAMKLYAHWTESDFIKLDLQGGKLYKTGSNRWHNLLYNRWNPKKFYTSSGNQYAGITVKDGKKIGRQAEGGRSYVKGWQLPTARNLYFNTSTSGASYRGVKKVEKAQKLNGKIYNKKEKFLGWYSKPNGQGNLVKPKDYWYNNLLESGDRTLYAAWEEASTITYNANGGHFGKKLDNVIKQKYNKYEGQKYPRVAKPKMRGYKFIGWYDAPVGGNKIELGKATHLIDKNKLTLYAHWEIRQFKVKFNPNGGSVNPTYKMVTYNTAYGTLPTPTRSGYKFDGWFTKKSGGTQIKGTEIYTRVKNQTLYAHWTQLKFQVTVSDVQKTSWNQSYTVTNGNLTGFTITYYISESKPTVKTATSSDHTPTGKKDGTAYYVWAHATNGGNVVYSTNYIKVVTAHAHNENCYTTSVSKYNVKADGAAYGDTRGILKCSTGNHELIGNGNPPKYISYVNNYKIFNSDGSINKTTWCNNLHATTWSITDFSAGNGSVKVQDRVCKNCEIYVVSYCINAGGAWPRCGHYSNTLTCTKSMSSIQTNLTW